MVEYKTPQEVGSVAIHQLTQELHRLFDECQTVEEAHNTTSAIHKAIEKQRKVINERVIPLGIKSEERERR